MSENQLNVNAKATFVKEVPSHSTEKSITVKDRTDDHQLQYMSQLYQSQIYWQGLTINILLALFGLAVAVGGFFQWKIKQEASKSQKDIEEYAEDSLRKIIEENRIAQYKNNFFTYLNNKSYMDDNKFSLLRNIVGGNELTGYFLHEVIKRTRTLFFEAIEYIQENPNQSCSKLSEVVRLSVLLSNNPESDDIGAMFKEFISVIKTWSGQELMINQFNPVVFRMFIFFLKDQEKYLDEIRRIAQLSSHVISLPHIQSGFGIIDQGINPDEVIYTETFEYSSNVSKIIAELLREDPFLIFNFKNNKGIIDAFFSLEWEEALSNEVMDGEIQIKRDTGVVKTKNHNNIGTKFLADSYFIERFIVEISRL